MRHSVQAPSLESIQLTVDDRVIAGIRQHDKTRPDLPKMLCIHGWLDNANSFVPMMPYLPSFDLVAIDLPGHGYSDPLPAGYNVHELTYQLSRIMAALEWDQCHLTGHSLGGCIVPYLAVARPQCVQSLTLIEASGPLSESASKLPQRLKRSLDDRLDTKRYNSRTFSTKDEAVASRLKAATMHQASARLIIDRQLSQTENGFEWRFDPRWRMASSQYQTEEQVMAVLSAVQCPALTVIADDGFLSDRSSTETRLGCLQNRTNVCLPGNHHLHMDTPEPVAAAINRYLDATPNLGG